MRLLEVFKRYHVFFWTQEVGGMCEELFQHVEPPREVSHAQDPYLCYSERSPTVLNRFRKEKIDYTHIMIYKLQHNISK